MKRIILLTSLIFLLISSCSTGNIQEGTPVKYATPTTNPLFPNIEGGYQKEPIHSQAAAIPTLSNIFQPVHTQTIEPVETPILATTTWTPTVQFTSIVPTVAQVNVNPGSISSAVFNERLDSNWLTIADKMKIDLENETYTFQGKKSIKLTPTADHGTAYFVVAPNVPAPFSRDNVLGIEFKLSGGDKPIGTADLAVAVLGSNELTYYSDKDKSVTSDLDPVFPETRLYHLNFNQTIPANTWVNVIIWLDDLIYEPIYTNVTGFYIKTDEGYRNSFYIDDVQMISISDERGAALATTPTPILGMSSSQTRRTINISINTAKNLHNINPMIYGVSGAYAEVLADLKPGLNSWGGNTSSRYNWKLGNAWNAGRDYFYQNTNFGYPNQSVSDLFIEDSQTTGVPIRLTLPTLGWVAKNSDPKTCSFPRSDGSCGDSNNESCLNPGEFPNPRLANVPSNTDLIVEWVNHMLADQKYDVKIFAMDNEPELWGINHYDVHPKCTTYQEILQKYTEYAAAVRKAAPSAQLAGPVTCCWQFYWNSAAGELDKLNNGNRDFLPWFLSSIRKYDRENGITSINVLDLHYYPEGLYNQDVDTETAAHRLRATRSLWDQQYVDESWINEPVYLIPRMKTLISQFYPGLKFGISEWNFGADQDINGALAIADVLGIFGREEVYYANYWTYPAPNSPGAFAFKLYTNYDGEGGHFGEAYVDTMSDNSDAISAFGSLDRKTNLLHLMVINKDPVNTLAVKVDLTNYPTPSKYILYRYSQEDLKQIVKVEEVWPDQNGVLIIPPYSINHFILIP